MRTIFLVPAAPRLPLSTFSIHTPDGTLLISSNTCCATLPVGSTTCCKAGCPVSACSRDNTNLSFPAPFTVTVSVLPVTGLGYAFNVSSVTVSAFTAAMFILPAMPAGQLLINVHGSASPVLISGWSPCVHHFAW